MMPDGLALHVPPRLDARRSGLVASLQRRRVAAQVGAWSMKIVPPTTLEGTETFDVTLGGEPARIEVPHERVVEILEALDPAASQAGGEARRLLLELALDEVAVALDPVLPVAGGAGEVGDAPISVGLWFEDWGATLHLSDAAATHLLAALDQLAPDPAPVPVPVWLRMRLGNCELPMAELRALRPGDVLLPSTGLDDDEFVLVVAAERWVWQGRRSPGPTGGVELMSPRCRAAELGMEGWTMDDETPAELADASLDELPVRLVFEAGRVEVAMSELAQLGAGHIFALPGAAGLVDILANGRRIGQGELVQVGETAGVRLVRLTA